MYVMYYYEVAPARIVRRTAIAFTYNHSENLATGQIVLIELGKKEVVGIILHRVSKPSYETKPVQKVLSLQPIPKPLLDLGAWISDYYATHFALVLQTMLPKGIQKNRRLRDKQTRQPIRNRTKFLLNKDQRAALEQIQSAPVGTILLHGITGSGKTRVYIECAKESIKSGKSVILLVPEIALTPQLIDEFSAQFDNVILAHSQQTESHRHQTWQRVLTATEPQIIIGPRSALFLPVEKLGLVIIDESHEPSYKQEQSPRYSALRAASMLAKFHQSKVLLGSATPSVHDYYLANETKKPIIELANTARPSTPPDIKLVDMKNRKSFTKNRYLSDVLLHKIQETHENGGQTLIFHNRRGSAQSTLCDVCGWYANCKKCCLPLTLHADEYELRCHLCGKSDKIPTFCPICHSVSIVHRGIGTKAIESDLKKIFPLLSVARFDGDNGPHQTLNTRYKEIYEGSVDVMIGTQIVAKGLDLPKLRLVGIVQADTGLYLPDFSASERTFQLIAQVVGRVGRSHHSSSVIVQSFTPEHPAISDGVSQNYLNFYHTELTSRKRAKFPPFVFLLKLTCNYKTEAIAIQKSQEMARKLIRLLSEDAEVLGPTPSFYERPNGTYRWQIVIKSKKRSILLNVIDILPASHWQFELDPTSLL